MTVEECLEAVSHTDTLYKSKEDKNYYMVHKVMELIKLVKDEDVEELRNRLFDNYSSRTYLSFCDYVLLIMSKKDNCQNKINTNNIQYNQSQSTNIMEFYNSYDENLIRYIKGHLFLEFAMNTIIMKALNINTEKDTFNNKIDLLLKKFLVSKKERDLLKDINRQRNKIAHNLNYTLTFDTIYDLLKLSVEAGVDYSDSTIYKNKKLSKEWYGIEGIITELFPNTFCHLFYKNEQYFEDISKYMC